MLGRFITFEGCDGVGKSTQIRFLKDYLLEHNIDAVFTREPGGTFVAEKIREIILDKTNTGMTDMCELLLYSAARAEHVDKVIKPLLEQGKLVICDRFTDSTFAYQGYGRGIDENVVLTLNELSTGGVHPEVTVFLDAPPSEASRRQSGRLKRDRLESEGDEFHNKVYEGYKKAGKISPERFVIISADLDKFTTFQRILTALKSRGII